MIPFYPKFASAEDAPNYGPTDSEDTCETCAHYRDLGNQGFCEKFSFSCRPDFSCDDYRASGTTKLSSLVKEVEEASIAPVRRAVISAAAGDPKGVYESVEKLAPSKYRKLSEALRTVYSAAIPAEKVSSLGPYAAFGALGAGLYGAGTAMRQKDRALNDLRLHRSGRISDNELKRRLKEYGVTVGVDATVGGLGGLAGTAAVRKILKPQVMRLADDATKYVGQKVDEAGQQTLKSIDELATKHREASAREARELADSQRASFSEEISKKKDEIVDALENADLLKGTRRGLTESAGNVKKSIRERLSAVNPFGRRKRKWQRIAEGLE